MKFLLINGSKCHKKATQFLIQEAKKQFDSVLSVPLNGVRVQCIDGKTKLFYKNTDLTKFDACYARLFAEDFVFGEIILDILENEGVYIPTSPEAFQIANHKYYTVKVLSKISVPVPKSSLCVGPKAALIITKKTGFPVVVKLLSGFGGKGVMLVQNESEFKPLLDTLNIFKEFIALQEFIKNKGEDIRCYVVGDVIHSVKRIAAEGDWRANVSRGGKAQITRLPSEQREIVFNSAKIIGFELGAVDLLQTDGRCKVVEVNFSPGMMIKFFNRKFAEIFIRFIHKRAREKKLVV